MNTPWGYAQHTKTLVPGHVYDVSTAGHGGILCSKEWAEENLSAPARWYAYPGRWQDGYAFEEDSSWSIVYMEHPEIFPTEGDDRAEVAERCNAGEWQYRRDTDRPLDIERLQHKAELYERYNPQLAAELHEVLFKLTHKA